MSHINQSDNGDGLAAVCVWQRQTTTTAATTPTEKLSIYAAIYLSISYHRLSPPLTLPLTAAAAAANLLACITVSACICMSRYV